MIRKAVESDMESLVDLGAAMHRESNYAALEFDRRNTEAFIRWLMGLPLGLVLVAERDHELVGFIGGLASPPWFGNGRQLTATDVGLYVRPENRRGATAIQLVEGFVKWGKDLGCVQIRAGTNAGDAGQAANAIYEHFGLKRAGYCFVMDNLRPVVGQSFDGHLVVQ